MSGTLRRIMLVEDEPDIQVIARMALERIGGYTIAVCNSGSEALAKAPIFGPDVILLDVMMPDMDGPHTLRALRETARVTTPVIFMTAKVQPSEVAEYKALGALDVIAKPFDPMTLARTVRAIWEANNERMG